MEERKLEKSPIIYYISGGEKREWILFLHAAFVDHNMFARQVEDFGGQYNILLLDIIGHGQSRKTKKGDGIEKMSVWIREILDAEKIEKIHLVGISLGAVLAQDFANYYPEYVSSLACFGGYNINNFDMTMQKENAGEQMRMMLRALVSVRWFAKENKKVSAYTKEAQDAFYGMNSHFSKSSFRYLAGLGHMVNVHPKRERNYPLIIGCGEYDIPLEKQAVWNWKADEPQGEVVILKGAGHCVNMDVPEEFHAVLERFYGNEVVR